jgi:hypothetical protein
MIDQQTIINCFAMYGILMVSFEIVKRSDKYLNYDQWFDMPEWMYEKLFGRD